MLGNNIRWIVGTGLMIASFTIWTIMVKGLSPSAIAMNQAKDTYAVTSDPTKYLDAANAYSNAIVDANISQKPMTPAEKKALYEKLLAAEMAKKQTTTSNWIQLPVTVQTQGTSKTTTPVAKPTTAQIATTTTTKTTTPAAKPTTTTTTQSNTAAQQQAAAQAAAQLAAQQQAQIAAQQQADAQAAAQAAANAAAQQAAQAAAAQQAQIAAQQAAQQQAASGRRTRAS